MSDYALLESVGILTNLEVGSMPAELHTEMVIRVVIAYIYEEMGIFAVFLLH